MAWMDFAERAPMRRVEGGLKARSTRGAIGSSWWSKRFLAVLESFALGSRLTRGKHYARAGQVLSLRVAPGEVRATVQGSRAKPYAVRIGLATFRDSVWAAVERRLADQALFSARLLAGELPGEIEAVFDAAGAPLFPPALRDLSMSCSCPDSAVPCKHLAATFYLLAEAFDDDPFQVLLWRGRPRETLLSRLRTLRNAVDDEGVRRADGGGAAGSDAARDGVLRPDRGGGAALGAAHGGGVVQPDRDRASALGAAHGAAGGVLGADRDGDAALGAGRDGGAALGGGRDEGEVASFGAAAALRDLPETELAELVDRFWLSPVPLTGKAQPVLAVEADLLLRQLPTPGPGLGGRAFVDALRLLYKRFG